MIFSVCSARAKSAQLPNPLSSVAPNQGPAARGGASPALIGTGDRGALEPLTLSQVRKEHVSVFYLFINSL